MKYYKVKFGYGKDEYISIDEDEVEKALTAQVTGKVALLKNGSISGNTIQSILPDWNRAMGWNRDYQLTGEDYQIIGTEKQNNYTNFLEFSNSNVQLVLSGRPRVETLNDSRKSVLDMVKMLSDNKKIAE